MDIRKTQVSDIDKTVVTNDGEIDFMIKMDSITQSKKIKESIIYNLVQKFQTIEEMKMAYTDHMIKSSDSLLLNTYIHSSGMFSINAL